MALLSTNCVSLLLCFHRVNEGGILQMFLLLLYLMQSLHFILGIFDQLDVFAKLVRAVNN